MMAEKSAGRPINQEQHHREIQAVTGRTNGAVQYKLCNVSAVLDDLGVPWMKGYTPYNNYQDALAKAVEQHLIQTAPEKLLGPSIAPVLAPDGLPIVVAPPSAAGDGRSKTSETVRRRLIAKFDPAARDFRNRLLGKAGEELVVYTERRRLQAFGRHDLAKDVRWVSDLDGDGAGYDIRSFEPDGQLRLLEVKTTCGNERTPFWITRRECEVAAEQPEAYRIRRLFHFRNQVSTFDIAPPLDNALRMTPTTFLAMPSYPAD
ncbi:DUF3883 domain-containing protein [Rhodopseudomonas palustris]|nr:DUF3883 domain-containing protein [Rhodopseudomonas palustris]